MRDMSTQRQCCGASCRHPAPGPGSATLVLTPVHRARIVAPRRAHGRVAALALVLGAVAGCAGRPVLPDYPPGPGEGLPRRGGSAVLVREEDPDYLDPALSYGSYSAPVNQAIFHTLIDYADARGADGARLLPDLAERVPDVREAGTLYCMKVRAAARFGAPLGRHITAADFKYSIERLFRVNSPGVSFYRNIVGADRVLAGQDSVLPGVIARGDSLYLRLRRPDPVFPHLIAMTFTAPVPREVAESHRNDSSQHTVATGPYRVAEFIPRRRVLLVRNPDYCGPPAYLDTIEVRLGVSATSAVAMIRRGLVDGGFFEVPAADYARLRTDSLWRRQLDVADGLETDYLFFNVKVKPFDDVRVRQAVGWALDRRALVKVWSGRGQAAGEFLPPGMPGGEQLHRYEGPDLARARSLLRAAGYPNGFSTRLYGYTAQPYPRIGAVIQQQLAAVGIRAQLDMSEAAGYTAMAGDTANHVPFGWYAWIADYVDPSNFFDTLLNGRRIAPIYNNNLSMFDDEDVNDLIERAMATAGEAERTRLWHEVERRVMDRAPVMPLVHVYESRLYSPRLGGWYRHVTRILKLETLYRKQSVRAPGLASAEESATRGAKAPEASARAAIR
jgi:ABC-type transport system substrate-binding protein